MEDMDFSEVTLDFPSGCSMVLMERKVLHAEERYYMFHTTEEDVLRCCLDMVELGFKESKYN